MTRSHRSDAHARPLDPERPRRHVNPQSAPLWDDSDNAESEAPLRPLPKAQSTSRYAERDRSDQGMARSRERDTFESSQDSQTNQHNQADGLDGYDGQGGYSGHGRARKRTHRRQTGDRSITLPSLRGVRWTYVVIGAVLAGLIGLVAAISGVIHGAAAVPVAAAVVPATAGPTPTLSLNIQPWSGKGRFTLLLLGVDKRPDESLAGSRTDLMIIMSIDPVSHSAGILSIPRDLFVPIPGQSDMQRINSAYELGELNEPGSGPKLAMQAIQYNFGIPVNNYVLFTFDAVTAVIDAVGGVDINVPTAIDDEQFPDMNYGYDPLRIPAGLIHMDGTLALKYARTRHQDDDFERTHRQQAIILAVRDKVVQLNMLPQLVQQAPILWTQLQGNFLTDLSLDQVLSLAVYARGLPPGSIQHATIEGQYVRPIQWQGDSVLTPDRSKIGDLMTQVFGPNYAH